MTHSVPKSTGDSTWQVLASSLPSHFLKRGKKHESASKHLGIAVSVVVVMLFDKKPQQIQHKTESMSCGTANTMNCTRAVLFSTRDFESAELERALEFRSSRRLSGLFDCVTKGVALPAERPCGLLLFQEHPTAQL